MIILIMPLDRDGICMYTQTTSRERDCKSYGTFEEGIEIIGINSIDGVTFHTKNYRLATN